MNEFDDIVADSEENPKHEIDAFELDDDFDIGAGTSAYQSEMGADPTSAPRHTDWEVAQKTHPERKPPLDDIVGPDWFTPPLPGQKGKAEVDIDMLCELGIQTLRVGIEWARIQPQEGHIDQEALQRYKDIINYMVEKGMRPILTLHHWTFPPWLAERGGWHCRQFPEIFEQYARTVATEFPQVHDFILFNEPTGVLGSQYLSDYFPPHERRLRHIPRVLANMAQANKRGYLAIKALSPEARVGTTHAILWTEPQNPRSGLERRYSTVFNKTANILPIKLIVGKYADFIGINFYTGYDITRASSADERTPDKPSQYSPLPRVLGFKPVNPHGPVSDFDWAIAPDMFYRMLLDLKHEFPNMPLIISENGIADRQDRLRSMYILTHLIAIHEAIQHGVDIRGYWHWSATDNQEWLEGMGKICFGLIGIDPRTGKRFVRDSARVFGEIARTRRVDVRAILQSLPPDLRAQAIQFIKSIQYEIKPVPINATV